MTDVCQILVARDGLDQRANVAKNRELALIPYVEQPFLRWLPARQRVSNLRREIRMQSKLPTARRVDRQQRRLRNCEPGSIAHRCVRVVLRVERHDHVVAVVAAVKKNTNQSLVVAGNLGLLLGERVNQAKLLDAGKQSRGTDAAACLFQKLPA